MTVGFQGNFFVTVVVTVVTVDRYGHNGHKFVTVVTVDGHNGHNNGHKFFCLKTNGHNGHKCFIKKVRGLYLLIKKIVTVVTAGFQANFL